MPRRRKKDTRDVIEAPVSPETSENHGRARLYLLVHPSCPHCKMVLRNKTVRYYISKGYITLITHSMVKDIEGFGEWALGPEGLVLQLATPTFVMRCGGNTVLRYTVTPQDFMVIDSVVAMLVNLSAQFENC